MSETPNEPKPVTPESQQEPGLDAAQQSLSDALRVSFAVLKGLLVVLLVVYLCSGTIRVNEQNTAVRYRFGERVGTFGPGWHLGLPFPIEQVIMVPRNTQNVRLDKSFWYDNPEDQEPDQLAFQALDPLKDSFLITGDTNVIHVQFEVEYVIKEADVDNYLRNVGNLDRANEIVQIAAERGMIHYIASQTVEDIITRSNYDKATIAGHIQDVLRNLNTGITVQQVLIDNENQSMPNQVRQAYNSVTQAQAQRVSSIEMARREYNQTLGRTAGGAHEGLLLLIRAYEFALSREEMELAGALRTELDASIAALHLPDQALLEAVGSYRAAVTQAASSDDPQMQTSADEQAGALLQALASEPAGRSQGQPIAGEIASTIRLAEANRSGTVDRAEQYFERFESSLEAYRRAPLVLANERLQSTREAIMTSDLTMKIIGNITRINATPDPEDVEAINNANFDSRRQRATEESRR